jgi:excisionase family DNA binding protein
MKENLAGVASVACDGSLQIAPLTVRVREACRLTGMGRSKLYLLIQEGHIDVVEVGSMTLIPMKSLEKFLGLDEKPPV